MNIRRVEEKGENFSHLVTVGAPDFGLYVLYDKIIPSRLYWRLRSFGNYLGTVGSWGIANSFWTIEINGVMVADNGLIADQVGYAAARQDLSSIVAFPGDRVRLIAHNLTAADLQMGISMGWNLEYGD